MERPLSRPLLANAPARAPPHGSPQAAPGCVTATEVTQHPDTPKRAPTIPGRVFSYFHSFSPRAMPYMVRASYRRELSASFTFPLAASLAEGSFTAVVAAKNFNAGVILMSLITAAPMFGNVLALFWSDLAAGRRKVPFINRLQFGVILMIASVAFSSFVPPDLIGWVFAAQIVAARLLASGIITLRSTIWRCNYPRHLRGHVTSRIATVSTLVLAIATFAGSFILDLDPAAYVYLYPAAALIGLVGIHQFSKIRVRHEFRLMREERAADQIPSAEVDEAGITDETAVLNYSPPPSPFARFSIFRLMRQARQVLRDDPRFRTYQRWQMVSGFAFMMTAPALIYLISVDLTNRKENYLLATFVAQLIPMAVNLIAVPLWAPLFDRLPLARFRVIQGFATATSMLLFAVGAFLPHATPAQQTTALAVIAVGQIFMGLTNAAGTLAWNLGHNEFAPPEKTSLYMGVHVMLTGVRGCLAPFAGAFLFQHVLGSGIFLLTLALSTTATLGFYSMSKTPPPKQPPLAP